MVAALILARKEGLDRTLRDGFAQTGIVHLLAISGFHVGVVTGMVLALLRLVRVTRSRSALVAVGVIWAYVGLIGAPAAAVRAALILSFVSLARALNRPTARWGPLGAALLVSLVWDPDALRSAGFQLSFAGAAGLLAWTRPIERAFRALLGHRVPGLLQALATGIAATAATLPFVVWHFEQLSLVGIPATLLASPLVALAVPGALVSLALEAVHSGAAAFVAGGVDSLLAVLESGVRRLSATSWASVWLPRRAIVVPIAAGLAGVLVQRRLGRTRGLAGRTGAALWACVMLTLWPLVAGAVQRGTVEVVVFDVGQGDAIGIRTPRGRWILVDTGPRTNAAASRTSVARHLRRRGVEHLETMVLTHADADHIGDGAEVLRSLTVGEVIDPGLVTGKPGYLEVLHAARDRDIPWRAARAGHEWAIDGLVLRILAPLPGLATGDTETNAASVVLHLRFGDFGALLMGDAPQSVEHALMDAFDGNVEVLKVGHHGSSTSTADAWLDRTRPKAAIVSVGRGNRYGHPAADVMTRLRRWGVPVHRTDLDGTVSVRGRPDGTFFVRTTR